MIKEIKRIDGLRKTYVIGQATRVRYIYKYMNMDTAILCLDSGKIRFVEPTQWEDQYERRFYTAKYWRYTRGIADLQTITPKFWANCFTVKPRNEAAWRNYLGLSGLASKCVQFKFDKVQLRKELMRYAEVNNCKIYEGLMDYSYNDFVIEHLHENGSHGHDTFFNRDFSLKHFFSLMLIKRDAFQHEEEIRYFIIPNQVGDRNTFVNSVTFDINWADIVKGIWLDKNVTDVEEQLFVKICRNNGITAPIKKFDLYKNPMSIITIE